MSEAVPQLREGFSVIRRAVGPDTDRLFDDLAKLVGEETGVELRSPGTERMLAIQAITKTDITSIPWVYGETPLDEVYRRLDEQVESLRFPLFGVELTYAFPSYGLQHLERYANARIDPLHARIIEEEAEAAVDAVYTLSGTRTPELFRAPRPKATVAYVGAQAMPGTAERVLCALNELLPRTLDFEPAIKLPDLA